MIFIIFQEHLILRGQNYNLLSLRPCSDVGLPTDEKVLSVLLHLLKMRICKSAGNIF